MCSVSVSALLKLLWRKQKLRKVPQRKRGLEKELEQKPRGRKWETKTLIRQGLRRVRVDRVLERRDEKDQGSKHSGSNLGSHSYSYSPRSFLDS